MSHASGPVASGKLHAGAQVADCGTARLLHHVTHENTRLHHAHQWLKKPSCVPAACAPLPKPEGPFSPEEDQTLLQLVTQHGNKWKLIGQELSRLPPRGLPLRGLPSLGLPPRGLPPRGRPPREMPPRGLPPRGCLHLGCFHVGCLHIGCLHLGCLHVG